MTLERGDELTFRDHCGVNRRAAYRGPARGGGYDVAELTKGEYRVFRSIREDMVLRVWKKKRKQVSRKRRLKERKKADVSTNLQDGDGGS